MIALDGRVQITEGERFVILVVLEVLWLGGLEHPQPIALAVMCLILGECGVVAPERITEPPGRIAAVGQEREAGRIREAAGAGAESPGKGAKNGNPTPPTTYKH